MDRTTVFTEQLRPCAVYGTMFWAWAAMGADVSLKHLPQKGILRGGSQDPYKVWQFPGQPLEVPEKGRTNAGTNQYAGACQRAFVTFSYFTKGLRNLLLETKPPVLRCVFTGPLHSLGGCWGMATV